MWWRWGELETVPNEMRKLLPGNTAMHLSDIQISLENCNSSGQVGCSMADGTGQVQVQPICSIRSSSSSSNCNSNSSKGSRKTGQTQMPLVTHSFNEATERKRLHVKNPWGTPTSSSMFTISAVEVEDNDEDAPAAANDHHVASVDDDDNDDDGVDICSSAATVQWGMGHSLDSPAWIRWLR
uniref:HDC15174 n=1 Tax=Drosophila melanogaster TaxID=7227 RepID=Q6IJD0_DROME|nr:TPA_inf: HDC15174 [Drosophila melanogaster]